MKNTLSCLPLLLWLMLLVPQCGQAFVHTNVPYRYYVARLDSALVNSTAFEHKRQAFIDSLTVSIKATETDADKLPLLLECTKEWRRMSTDSAIAVSSEGIRLAKELGDKEYEQLFICERSLALFYSGQIDQALRNIQHVYNKAKDPMVLEACDYTALTINLTHGLFNASCQVETDYLRRARHHLVRLMSHLTQADSIQATFYQGFIYLIDGNTPGAINCFSKVIDNTSEENRLNLLSHSMMGNLLLEEEDYECAVKHLAIASRLCIENTDRQVLPMLKLVEAFYGLNNYTQAAKYISPSLHNAVDGGMRYNLMRFNNVVLDVNESMENERNKRSVLLTTLLVTMLLLLVVVAYQIYYKRREVKRLQVAEERLARANKAKDTYIAEFMNLCSSYIESLEAYNTLSKHKIAAGQTEQLLEFMRSGKVINQQREKFFDVFDKAFHKLYPDYVEQVNSLLQPSKRISVSTPGDLTTELRVLALSRLGIEDAQAIARFLGVTPSTVYTYRNKLRNRALDRETFDEAVKQISA